MKIHTKLGIDQSVESQCLQSDDAYFENMYIGQTCIEGALRDADRGDSRKEPEQ